MPIRTSVHRAIQAIVRACPAAPRPVRPSPLPTACAKLRSAPIPAARSASPPALCGIVGFKPSRQRVPTEGAFPLSTTLDSIGPLARSVADCAKADAILSGEDFASLEPIALAGLALRHCRKAYRSNRWTRSVAAAFAAASEIAGRGWCSAHRRSVAAVRRNARSQRLRRHRSARGLRHSSRPAQAARRRYRPERARCGSSAVAQFRRPITST